MDAGRVLVCLTRVPGGGQTQSMNGPEARRSQGERYGTESLIPVFTGNIQGVLRC